MLILWQGQRLKRQSSLSSRSCSNHYQENPPLPKPVPRSTSHLFRSLNIRPLPESSQPVRLPGQNVLKHPPHRASNPQTKPSNPLFFSQKLAFVIEVSRLFQIAVYPLTSDQQFRLHSAFSKFRVQKTRKTSLSVLTFWNQKAQRLLSGGDNIRSGR